MIKLNMNQFINDIKSGVLEQSKESDGNINLTNYIYNKQPNTRMWHYVNQDVGITYSPKHKYGFIEDYGNGCPNWAYDVCQDMYKVLKRVTQEV